MVNISRQSKVQLKVLLQPHSTLTPLHLNGFASRIQREFKTVAKAVPKHWRNLVLEALDLSRVFGASLNPGKPHSSFFFGGH